MRAWESAMDQQPYYCPRRTSFLALDFFFFFPSIYLFVHHVLSLAGSIVFFSRYPFYLCFV